MKQPLSFENNSNYSVFDRMLEGVQVLDYDYNYLYLNEVVVAQAKSSLKDLLHHKMTEKNSGNSLRNMQQKKTSRQIEPKSKQ